VAADDNEVGAWHGGKVNDEGIQMLRLDLTRGSDHVMFHVYTTPKKALWLPSSTDSLQYILACVGYCSHSISFSYYINTNSIPIILLYKLSYQSSYPMHDQCIIRLVIVQSTYRYIFKHSKSFYTSPGPRVCLLLAANLD
jgi:hypothetical protein